MFASSKFDEQFGVYAFRWVTGPAGQKAETFWNLARLYAIEEINCST